ncbi:glycosyltransferase family 2 protein [Bombilactobacillus bombi]
MMATYNGEKYLKQQINSILKQTYQNFVLLIRDDNSTDNTQNIINEYELNYPDKIVVIKDHFKAGSAKDNFGLLVRYVQEHCLDDFEYFMFSDQDDFWRANKVELSISRLLNCTQPTLVHTDLKVVDQNLKLINNSFMKMSSLNGNEHRLQRLLVQNNVVGCTMAWNKALMQIIKPNFDQAIMHDWFIALIACCYGKIVFINEETVLYRQHDDNAVGVKSSHSFKYIKEGLQKLLFAKNTWNIVKNQSIFLLDAYKNIPYSKVSVIASFTNAFNHRKVTRIRILIKNGFIKQGVIRIIGEFISS